MGERLANTHELVSARLHEAGQLYTTGRRELVELLVRAARPGPYISTDAEHIAAFRPASAVRPAAAN